MTTQPQPRTQIDDYNRLLAIAFEERVNAQATAAQLEQKNALAGQIIEQLRKENAELAEKLKAPEEAVEPA
jgi:hypothetical protein